MFDLLLSKQQLEVKSEFTDFVKNEVDPKLVKAMDAGEVTYPREYIHSLAARAMLGLRFSPEYGGRGLDWVSELAAIEQIGVLGTSLACLYSLVSIVGEALHAFGTEQQKRKYLEPVLKGKLCVAEALTEPRGGSDFFGATTRAVRDGDHYRLTGQKRFVVGAEGADLFLVYAKTAPEAPPHLSLSTFLVERDYGVEVKHIYGLLGTRGGGAGRILFRDVKVPATNLVGPENGGAMVFNRMMYPERLTSAAGAVGGAQAALDVAVDYSTKRKAFGKPIMKFQGVSFKVADSIAKLDAARALNYVAGRSVDAGIDSRRLVSEAKKIATQTMWEVVNDAMQILGGIGYTDVYPVERFLRDARLALIWTGTNEIMNLLIQHEYYKEAAKAKGGRRDVEQDAIGSEAGEEKIYE